MAWEKGKMISLIDDSIACVERSFDLPCGVTMRVGRWFGMGVCVGDV